MKKAIYCRVSTSEQDLTRQQKYNDVKIYEDKCSGSISLEDRPMGARLIQDIEQGKITEVEVSSLSRLGRSMSDLLKVIDFFEVNKVNLIINDLAISSRPNGKSNKLFNIVSLMLSSFAEMQRVEMLESQAQAIAIKRQKGLKYHDTERKKEDTTELLEKYKNVVKDLKKGIKDAQILKTNYIIFDKNYHNATDKEKAKLTRAISRNTLKKIKNLI